MQRVVDELNELRLRVASSMPSYLEKTCHSVQGMLRQWGAQWTCKTAVKARVHDLFEWFSLKMVLHLFTAIRDPPQ